MPSPVLHESTSFAFICEARNGYGGNIAYSLPGLGDAGNIFPSPRSVVRSLNEPPFVAHTT
jgi:hypothetical protein